MKIEKIAPNTSDGTDPSLTDIKTAKQEARKQKKLERRELRRLKKEYKRHAAVLPPSKRPMICPPDSSDAAMKHIAFGIILRILVIFFAVAGLTFFVSEAFGFDINLSNLSRDEAASYTGIAAEAGFGFIAPWALFFVSAIALCCLWKYGRFIGIPAVIGAVVVLTMPNPLLRVYEAALTVYNGALGHMKYMGFYAIDAHQVPLTPHTGTPGELVRTAVVLFTLICALVFVPFCIKRVRIAVPGIFSAAMIIFIFVYNLSRSNWALAVTTSAFAALLVMYVYDRIFIAPPKAGTTDEVGDLFGASEEPPLPERLLSKKAAREAKKAARAEKRARRKSAEPITVDREISDYFADAKPKKVKQTRKQKLAAKAEKKAERQRLRRQKADDRRSVRIVKKYRSRLLLRRIALGGLAGAGMFIVAFAAMFLPAASTTDSFKTIPAIDDKLEYYRDYVTAYLMGDDPALDVLAFEGNSHNFDPRDTMATPRYYTYTPLMTVESNYPGSIYLRGWIATDYVDGKWVTAEPNSDLLEHYRSMFPTNTDASESIFYNFFKIMTDDGVPEEGKDVTDSIKRLEKYGYVISQVNIKRSEDFKDLILYMPSFHIRAYSPSSISTSGSAFNLLRKYGSDEASTISYGNYFDGLYTSYRAAQKTEAGYAAVAMIPRYKSDRFHINLADLITDFNRTRIAVENGRVPLSVSNSDERMGTFSLTLWDGSNLVYEVVSISNDGTKEIHIPQQVGVAVYTLHPDGSVDREMIKTPEIIDPDTGEPVQFYAPKLDTAVLYFESFDYVERAAFNDQATLLDKYTPFVYDTYTKRADSQIITDIFREIIDNAVVKEDYQDPVPADFSLAANKSEYKHIEYTNGEEKYELVSAVTDREVYIQRHKLVMEIINYLGDESRYTYTLSPTVLGGENTLDGIETFLSETHEGYCVQYASSLVLLLREAGIPARYVEGYIASGFSTNRSDDAVANYKSTVRDNNAHAWVEVWYDGIGWVQYEATPEYYDAMYVTESSSNGTVRPPSGGETTGGEEEEENHDPFEGMTEYEIEQLLEAQRREALRALITKIVLIASIILAVAAVIGLFFAIVLKRAKKSAAEREALLREFYETSEKSETVPDRTKVRRMGEMITNLLRECGFTPENGEFSSDFAARIAKECERELAVAAPEEGMTEFEAPRYPMREEQLVRVFDAIAAEEFGYGAQSRDLKLMARTYYRLHANLYRRRVLPPRRIVLYLFKREM
ncbi:MAG: transglutaminase family protein [Eubacteriales bacterium]